MKIAIDAHGGDNAPLEILKGCVMAVKELGVEIVLCGKVSELEKIMNENDLSTENISFVNANSTISMHDDPKCVVGDKKDSSMACALYEVKEGRADAFVSAGNTGAILMGATLIVKRIRGIKRAAIGTVLPSDNGPFILCDCGANTATKPEYLDQYAKMGTLYIEKMFGDKNPSVALLNNGAEETKGTDLHKEAYAILKEDKSINFIGNVEGRNMPEGIAKVVVTDGFTGNIALKLYEGVAMTLFCNIKDILKSNLKGKIAALLIMKGLKGLKKKMDYSEYGGAPLLGISKPVIKAHGSSNAKAFKNAIRQAKNYAESNMIEAIEKEL